MTDRDRRRDTPVGGAVQPPEIPREETPDDVPPTPAASEGAPLPGMPMSRDPLLNPGPIPIKPADPLD
jgi:hypothetical protein